MKTYSVNYAVFTELDVAIEYADKQKCRIIYEQEVNKPDTILRYTKLRDGWVKL